EEERTVPQGADDREGHWSERVHVCLDPAPAQRLVVGSQPDVVVEAGLRDVRQKRQRIVPVERGPDIGARQTLAPPDLREGRLETAEVGSGARGEEPVMALRVAEVEDDESTECGDGGRAGDAAAFEQPDRPDQSD